MKFEDTVIKSWPTGSRYICNPPVADTDRDTVILVNGYYDYDELLEKEGWVESINDGYKSGGRFVSYRKGIDNYIVTEEPDFFNEYVIATEVAKMLNLQKKEDRIALFQKVSDANGDYFNGLYKYFVRDVKAKAEPWWFVFDNNARAQADVEPAQQEPPF
jgi:hypothetical protein